MWHNTVCANYQHIQNNIYHVRIHKSSKIHIKCVRMDVWEGMDTKRNTYRDKKRALHKPVLKMDHKLKCMINSTLCV